MHFFALPREQKFGKYESTTLAEMLNSKNANEPYIFCKTSVEVRIPSITGSIFQRPISYFRYNLSIIGVAFFIA